MAQPFDAASGQTRGGTFQIAEYEKRPGEPPPNQSRGNDENVMTIFFVRAQETANEIDWPTD
jgi:hypothetical protein